MKLYEILYYFYSSTDQNEQAFDAMLKRCRSYMTGNYLASEDSVKRVLNASYELFKFVVEKNYAKKLFEVKMLCRSIISRCTKSFSSLEEYATLKTFIEEHDKWCVCSFNDRTTHNKHTNRLHINWTSLPPSSPSTPKPTPPSEPPWTRS